jgi:DNA-binding CsgD family transcriptional regulator
LLAAIAQAEQLDADLRRESAELSCIEERLSSLTRRQLEVLRHVVAGRRNKQIASDLGTALQTIKVHRARMMKKMKVRSIAELAQLAVRAGVSMATPSESTQPFILARRPTRTSLSGPALAVDLVGTQNSRGVDMPPR